MGRFLACIEAMVILVTGFASLYAFGAGSVTYGSIFAGTGFVALCVYLAVANQRGKDVEKESPGPAVPEDIDIGDLLRAEKQIRARYKNQDVRDYFTQYVTNVPLYLSRVDEQMELDGSLAHMTTTLVLNNLAADQSASGDQTEKPSSLLVPLVFLRKGLLFDGFKVRDGAGKVALTLSQAEVRGLLLLTLRSLFEAAIAARYDSQEEIDEAIAATNHDLHLVARDTICATAGRDKGAAAERLKTALAKIDEVGKTHFEQGKIQQIRGFCESLARDYVIVVEVSVPTARKFSLVYEHKVMSTQVGISSEHKRRLKHGLSPVVVDAPMTWAFRPDSYHFELAAPPGQYVYSHRLEALETAKPLSQDDFSINKTQQYVRTYYKQARTIAHLYIRKVAYGTEPSDVPDFKSVVRFREIPPGTLGNAVTVSLFTAVVVIYFAFFRESGLPTAASNSAVNISALLLGFPAFLAAALGRGITSDGIRRTSITAFYGLWACVALSALSVFLYIYDASRLSRLNFELRLFGSLRHLNAAWATLAFIGLLIYLILRKEKSDARRYYLGMMKSKPSSKWQKFVNIMKGN